MVVIAGTDATSQCGAEASWIAGAEKIYWNEIDSGLMQHAAARNEGIITVDGSISVETGKHTGRSPKDRFVVCEAETEGKVWRRAMVKGAWSLNTLW